MFIKLKVSKNACFCFLQYIFQHARQQSTNKTRSLEFRHKLAEKLLTPEAPTATTTRKAALRGCAAERSGKERCGSQETPLTDVRELRLPRADPPKALANSFSRRHTLGHFRQPPARAGRTHVVGSTLAFGSTSRGQSRVSERPEFVFPAAAAAAPAASARLCACACRGRGGQ